MPCTNVANKKELTSRKQIAGQKSKKFNYSSPKLTVFSPADSTSWSVAENVACQFALALTDYFARSPKIIRTYDVSNRMGFSNDMTSEELRVSLRVPSLTVRWYSSKQGKSHPRRPRGESGRRDFHERKFTTRAGEPLGTYSYRTSSGSV